MVTRHVHARAALLAAAHLVHERLLAFQQKEREVALPFAAIGRLGLLVGHVPHVRVGVVLEVDDQKIGRLGLLHAAQLGSDELGYLHGQVDEVALPQKIRADLFGEHAVFGELAALVVQVAERFFRMARHVALGVLTVQVKLFLREDVDARNEIENVQYRTVHLEHGCRP